MNTPRTDKVATFMPFYPDTSGGMELIDADFARRLERENAELLEALEKSVRYLADLNGCDWIKGDSVAGLDMKQRAKALQSIVFSAISKAKGEA